MKMTGKVVVADDVQANCDLLATILGREGYTVHTASDGLAALDLIVREMPDLVVTDVMMPGIDGFELCRRVKSNPATRLTPVIIVTSLGEREDRIAGINAGGERFPDQAVRSARAPGARPLAREPQAVHRRS